MSMAEKKTQPAPGKQKTERINVWLTPSQVEWLKSKKNVSETVRTLVMEAMNMDALAKSVKAGRKKK
jgi:hypothetical protein